MSNIEEIMREHLKDAEQQPPEGVWKEILQRMNAEQYPKRRKNKPLMATVTALLAVAMAMTVLVVSNKNSNNSVADNSIVVAERQTTTLSQSSPHEVLQVAPDAVTDAAVAREKKEASRANAQREEVAAVTTQPVDISRPSTPATTPAPPRATDGKPAAETVQNGIEETSGAPTQVEAVTQEEQQVRQKNEAPKTRETTEQPYVSIPNLVTPNGDGINDCWILSELTKDGNAQVRIFTAQGKMIFSSNNYANDFCGDDLPDGNYFYQIVVKEMNLSRRGVLVIRR